MASCDTVLRQTLHKTEPKVSALKTDLETWIPERDTVMTELISIAEEVDEIQHKSDVITSVGTTTSLAGVGLFFITGGISVAGGLLVAGAVTAIVVNMYKSLIRGALVQRAREMIDKDAEGQSVIREKISDIETQVENLKTVYSSKEMDKVRGIIYTSAQAKSKGWDLDVYSRKVHQTLMIPAVNPGMQILGHVGLFGSIISKSLVAITLPFVAFDLLGCLQRLLEDTRSKCSEEIRKTVHTMRGTRDDMLQLQSIIKKGALK